jgi:2-polyprenyl-3-methyl-5-hydroxy-6-metoxy-1,4-benzoquinol methylase
MSKADLDRIAAEYHTSTDVPDKHIEDLCQRYCGEWILQALGPAQRVLELGYGEGIITRMVLETGRQLTVIEGAKLLHEALVVQFGSAATAVHALFEEFTPHTRFDAVIASHVLEHVDDPVALLRRMRTWLTPGGRLIVVVPNKESLHRRLAVLMKLQPKLDSLGARDKLVGHQRVYSHETLATDLKAGGFEVAEATGFFLKPVANSMMLDYSPELLAAMNEIGSQLPKELLANIGVVATRTA